MDAPMPEGVRAGMPSGVFPITLSPEDRVEEARRLGVMPLGQASQIGEAPGALTELVRRIKEKSGWDRAEGVLPSLASGAYAAFATPFEALSMASRPVMEAVKSTPEPEYGMAPEIGDVLREGTVAGLLRSLGGKTLGGALGSEMRGSPILHPGRAESVLALRRPEVLDMLKYDLAEALRAGHGGLVRRPTIERLREFGVAPKMAEQAVQGEEMSALVDTMKRVRGSGGGLPGVTLGKKGILNFKTPELKQDTFDILKSLNVEGKSAERAIRWITKQKMEPVSEYAMLTTRNWSPTSVSAANPFFNWWKSDFKRRLAIGSKEAFHPETVMGLEDNLTEIYKLAHYAQDDIQKGISHFEALANQIAPRGKKIYLQGAETGVLDMAKLPPAQRPFAEAARQQVFDPLAKLHGRTSGAPGYIDDYFPKWMFTESGKPRDAILAKAQWAARKAGRDWQQMSNKEKAEALINAEKFMKGIPDEFFYGNLSKSRVSSELGQSVDLRTALYKYIHGAVRKLYMDRFYEQAKPLLANVREPALRSYALDYIDAFRGAMPGRFHVTSAALRMIQAWSKLGWNLTSPILNLSQTSINTYTVVGARRLAQAVALRQSEKGKRLIQTSGVTLDTAKHELTGTELSNLMNNTTNVMLYLFNKSERYNREIAMLAGYLHAQQKFPRAGQATLINEGRKLVNRTQFEFNVLGRPTMMRNPTGAALGQFKLYGYNQLRFIQGLRGPELARFALAVAMHGGMKGIPGAQWLFRVFWGLEAIQAMKDKDLPDVVENAIIGGLPRAAGISMEEDIGVGFLPESLKEAVPPFLAWPVALATNLPVALKEQGEEGVAARDRLTRETVRALPLAGVQSERVRQAYLTHKRGGLRFTPSGRVEERLTPGETAFMGVFGAKTRRAAQQQETREFIERTENKIAFARSLFYKLLLEGIAENDYGKVKEAFDEALKRKLFESTKGVQINERSFMPSAMRRFMVLPEQSKMELFKSPSFRKLLARDAEALMYFLSVAAGAPVSQAGSTGQGRVVKRPAGR